MEQFEGRDILNFVKQLPTDDKCKQYLAKHKWYDGFTSSKCQGEKGYKRGYRYHCCDCHHVERSTSNTLFHKVEFGLQKAFCMLFDLNQKNLFGTILS